MISEKMKPIILVVLEGSLGALLHLWVLFMIILEMKVVFFLRERMEEEDHLEEFCSLQDLLEEYVVHEIEGFSWP